MKALLFHKFKNICNKDNTLDYRNTNCFTILEENAIQTVSII